MNHKDTINKKPSLILFSLVFGILMLAFTPTGLFSFSSITKATKLRVQLLKQLRQLTVIISNFGDQKLTPKEKELIFGQHYPEYETNFNREREYNAYISDQEERQAFDFQTSYNECKRLFDIATVSLFSRNFITAEIQFMEVKWRMIRLFKGLSYMYIKRTQEILLAAASRAIEIITEFGPQNDKMRLFYIAYDPQREILLYNPKEYHYVLAKTKMNSYLQEGFKILQRAKNRFGYGYRFLYKDVKGNILIEKRAKTDKLYYEEYLRNFESNLKKDWLVLINDTRQAKMYAFEIFRLLNKYRFNTILKKYLVDPGKVDSLFDDRIPDQFQVDFVDSLRRVHKAEMKAFEKHLKFYFAEHKKYIQERNGKLFKVSGETDIFKINKPQKSNILGNSKTPEKRPKK